MTDHSPDRRTFLARGLCAGAALCGVCLLNRWPGTALAETAADTAADTTGQKLIDPKALNDCSYICPKDCPMLKGTLENDVELKKKAFTMWKLEERFGVEFDPDKIFCYGCKSEGKPEGEVLSRCDVRACVRDRQLQCCIECEDLDDCDKDLWRRFPAFKTQVVELRKTYLAQKE